MPRAFRRNLSCNRYEYTYVNNFLVNEFQIQYDNTYLWKNHREFEMCLLIPVRMVCFAPSRMALRSVAPLSGRAKRETAKGRNRTRNAHFRRFLQIFADFRLSLSLNQGIWEAQKTAGNRGFSQETAGNRRFLQKPVSPICCLPFGALLLWRSPGESPEFVEWSAVSALSLAVPWSFCSCQAVWSDDLAVT